MPRHKHQQTQEQQQNGKRDHAGHNQALQARLCWRSHFKRNEVKSILQRIPPSLPTTSGEPQIPLKYPLDGPSLVGDDGYL
jgi:hypothetical protein